jgi:E3 ubiquitin-protein ligase DMA1/2
LGRSSPNLPNLTFRSAHSKCALTLTRLPSRERCNRPSLCLHQLLILHCLQTGLLHVRRYTSRARWPKVMFSGPSLPTNSAPSPPTSPSRFGRGLTYLRNYTHHLHSRSGGDTSSPVSNPPPVTSSSPPAPSADKPAEAPPPQQSSPPTAGNGAWLPSQHGPISALTSAGSDRPQISIDTSPAQSAQTDLQAVEAMTRNSTVADQSPALLPSLPPPPQGNSSNQPLPSIRFVPHHDPRTHRPSLSFTAISRTLPNGDSVIRVGRYSERDGQPEPRGNAPSAAPVGFKSKVVSRRHCEFWCDNGQWYIRDVKSSSGTFLNHLRLSPPGVESKPWKVNDGDVVQLGIDFRGGEEMIFRCVKIRIECNRGWQKGLNPFKYVTVLLNHGLN